MKIWILAFVVAVAGVGTGVGLAVNELGTPESGDIWDARKLVTNEEYEKILDQRGGPRPKAVMPTLEHDFGIMEAGSRGTHSFVVRNEGNAPLTLKHGKNDTSCGCTIGELSQDVVAPGEEATITLHWDVRGDGATRQWGKLHTNDPLYPQFTLNVSGIVRAPAKIVPAKLTFPELDSDVIHEEKFKVLVYHTDKLEIPQYLMLNPDLGAFFQAKFEPMTAEEAAAEDALCAFHGTLSIKPGLPQGPFQQTIRLVTVPDLNTPIEMVITGNGGGESQMLVVGRGWDSKNERLHLGTISSSEGLTRKMDVLLRGEGHADTKLTIGKVTPAGLKVTLGEPITLGKGIAVRFPLTIEIPVGSKSMTYPGVTGDDVGNILVKSSNPGYPDMNIPLVFNVTR